MQYSVVKDDRRARRAFDDPLTEIFTVVQVRAKAELGCAIFCAEVNQRDKDSEDVAGQLDFVVHVRTVHVPRLGFYVAVVVRLRVGITTARHDLPGVE
eukprot:2622168-Prymnesium_polylepis.1